MILRLWDGQIRSVTFQTGYRYVICRNQLNQLSKLTKLWFNSSAINRDAPKNEHHIGNFCTRFHSTALKSYLTSDSHRIDTSFAAISSTNSRNWPSYDLICDHKHPSKRSTRARWHQKGARCTKSLFLHPKTRNPSFCTKKTRNPSFCTNEGENPSFYTFLHKTGCKKKKGEPCEQRTDERQTDRADWQSRSKSKKQTKRAVSLVYFYNNII